jgi:hypothetical protein
MRKAPPFFEHGLLSAGAPFGRSWATRAARCGLHRFRREFHRTTTRLPQARASHDVHARAHPDNTILLMP